MTQVSRKGFRDKTGKQVVIVPPKEEYAGEVLFQDSDAIDTILSEGVHHISYKKDGKRHPTQHILVVTRDYGKTGPIAPTREIVYQLLIDDLGGMKKRYRKFTDTELLEPDGDWTEWVSMIPTIDIDSSITEDGNNPVTGAAIYVALAARAPFYGSSIAIESDGNGNLPISYGGNVERDLNEFVSNTEAGKLYNIIVEFYKPNTYGLSYPAIVYWEISSQDDTVVHIYVGDYHFMASKPEGATAWEQEEFDRFKISTFLETF